MPLTPEQLEEIEAQRAASAETRRPTVPALEDILYRPLEVLDHGFVRVVDYMGDDGPSCRRRGSPTARAPNG